MSENKGFLKKKVVRLVFVILLLIVSFILGSSSGFNSGVNWGYKDGYSKGLTSGSQSQLKSDINYYNSHPVISNQQAPFVPLCSGVVAPGIPCLSLP